jgi:alkylhydroperoxidase family enzyme
LPLARRPELYTEPRERWVPGADQSLGVHLSQDARKLGESDDRMHLLNAWREAPIYTPRERAALAWTEAVTLIGKNHVPDEVYEEARRQFSEKELVDLTAAIIAINGWNRAAIAFRSVPQVSGVRIAA